MLLSKTRLMGIKKKCMKEMEKKRKAISRDNNKLQKPASAHWHIKWRYTTRWPSPYGHTTMIKSDLMFRGFTISKMFLTSYKRTRTLAIVLLLKTNLHVFLRMILSYLLLRKSCAINETAFCKAIPLDLSHFSEFIIPAMIDTIGGADKVNNFLAALNLRPISHPNLKNMDTRCGEVIFGLTEDLSKAAAQDAFSMEMRYFCFLFIIVIVSFEYWCPMFKSLSQHMSKSMHMIWILDA